MGQRILKWTLAIRDSQEILMPAQAEILTVQMQFGHPQIWAQCDEIDQDPPRPRKIAIYETGNPMPSNPGRYIATFQMESGMLVWHAYEAPMKLRVVATEWEDTIRNWAAEVVD